MWVLLAGSAWAVEQGGFAEVRGAWSIGAEGEPIQVVERVRPDFTVEMGERTALSATVEAALAQGRDPGDELRRAIEDSALGPALEATGCAWPEEANEALGISSASDWLAVERLFLDAYLPSADLRLGRQAVNWGSAILVNPTDPFPEVLLTEPWRERKGVNAARVTVPIRDVHRIQAVVGVDDTLLHPRVAGRATVNAAGTDVSLVGAWREEASDGFVGLDAKGTLGVGWWVEGVWRLGEDPHEEVAVGFDWSFPVLEAVVVAAQYYRNGAGSPDGYGSSLTSGAAIAGPTCAGLELFPEPDPFDPVLGGRDYAVLMASIAAPGAISGSVLWLQNLGDGSALAVPILTWAPRGWLEVAASAILPFSTWGDGGELNPGDDDLVLSLDVAGAPVTIDLSGLVPEATALAWTRVHF